MINNQCLYDGSMVEIFVSASKLFHPYIRRKKGCLLVSPLKSEGGRVVSDASDIE